MKVECDIAGQLVPLDADWWKHIPHVREEVERLEGYRWSFPVAIDATLAAKTFNCTTANIGYLALQSRKVARVVGRNRYIHHYDFLAMLEHFGAPKSDAFRAFGHPVLSVGSTSCAWWLWLFSPPSLPGEGWPDFEEKES